MLILTNGKIWTGESFARSVTIRVEMTIFDSRVIYEA